MVKPRHLSPEDFPPVLADLALEPSALQVVDPAPPPPSEHKPLPKLERGHLLYGQIGGGLDIPNASAMYRRRGDAALPSDGWALFFLKDQRADEELARWRNHLWPWLHVVAIYRIRGGQAERQILQRRELLPGTCAKEGVMLVARRREHVLSPELTQQKFDQNAAGWNVRPGEAGYAHYRWMRRYVGRFAPPRPAARILDFGCGAGWVGIEAALRSRGGRLCAFDPSPEMVRHAEENARQSGLSHFEARTGFGEDPPYPAAGEPPYELVLSSGVVSFAPNSDRWVAGLARTVAPGGTLVVGDIARESRGMRRRRLQRPLLPVREMNALTGDEMAALLASRGFQLEARAGYQLSRPVPELSHWSDTRARGAFSPLFLLANRLAAGRLAPSWFDSWVLRLRAPQDPERSRAPGP